MEIRELSVTGAFEVVPKQFTDDRGRFLEWLRQDLLSEALGHPLDLAQANCSVSAAGVLRGIHYADVPPGQAKYVTCAKGAVYDVVVDIRVGSPTFGEWEGVVLDDADRRAVYLSEGLGHAFLSLEDESTVMYLCSTPFAAEREHEIQPLDAELGIAWPREGRVGAIPAPILSPKDAAAPTLREAAAAGLLPDAAEVAAYSKLLRERS